MIPQIKKLYETPRLEVYRRAYSLDKYFLGTYHVTGSALGTG